MGLWACFKPLLFKHYKGNYQMAHIVTLPDGTIELHDIWGYDDIQNVQSSRDEELLTDEQCKAVLELLAYAFDANEGIHWIAVENAIDQVLATGA